MKLLSVLTALLAISVTACGEKSVATATSQPPAITASAPLTPAGHPAMGDARMPQAEPPLTQKAQVVSVINVTQYTYLEVMQDNKTRWLATAAPAAVAAKKSDAIQFDDGTLMNNFNSKLLNRTFPSITLVGRVVISGANGSK